VCRNPPTLKLFVRKRVRCLGDRGIDQSDIILALIVLLSNAGRVFGVDRYLHKCFPKIPIW